MDLPSWPMRLLGELEARARELIPRSHFDYFAGAAGDERTLAENAEAWRRVWVRPRVMVDVRAIDTSLTLLGRRLELPVLLAPMAAQRLLHADGEVAAARAAGAAGTVYCLSTRATTDLAEVAAAATGPLWFQLYVDIDRERSERVLARVAEHGFEAIVLTVDLPVGGRREREREHGDVRVPRWHRADLAPRPRPRGAPSGDRRLGRGADVARRRVGARGERPAGDRQGTAVRGGRRGGARGRRRRDRRLQPRRAPARRQRADGRRAARGRRGGRRPDPGARRRRHPRRHRRSARARARCRRGARRAARTRGAWRRAARRACATCSMPSATTCDARSRSPAARPRHPSMPAACAWPDGEWRRFARNLQVTVRRRGRSLHAVDLFWKRQDVSSAICGLPDPKNRQRAESGLRTSCRGVPRVVS